MRKVKKGFLLCIVCLFFGILPLQKYTASADTIVYITETGKCYHNWDCRYLEKSQKSIYLSEALEQGYRECTVCWKKQKQSNSSNTVVVQYANQESDKDFEDFIIWIIIGAIFLCVVIILIVGMKT